MKRTHRTILITGSTDGIGRLAARHLAKAGHTVWVHGRNADKVARTAASIQDEAGREVHTVVADLADLDAVRRMGEELQERMPGLDTLINNAGVYRAPRPLTACGLDLRFVVNYLAPFVLTHRLLPLLQRSPDGRVINVSSAAQSPVSLRALRGEVRLSEYEAYAQSKLALTMWSVWLAGRHPDLTVIPVNPGSLLDTKMVREAFGHARAPAHMGADILCWLAVDETARSHSGQFYDNDLGAFTLPHPDARDAHKVARLIQATEEVLQAC